MTDDSINHVSDVFLTPPEWQAWLRTFPLLASFGDQTPVQHATISGQSVPHLDNDYWQTQTESLETLALTKCSDLNIDGMFHEVTSIIDEDLTRFDSMVAYFGQFYPDGDPFRIQIESEIAACVKRDLSWMLVEWLIETPGFFTQLKVWYDLGRWPHAWDNSLGQIVVT